MSDANSIINGYTLFSVLGTGSQGTVYRATKNDQIFAVKVVLKRILNKVIPNTKQSLQNLLDTEIKIMKIIKSDYVVSLIDEFQT
jgi:serine/threonine protein kinase